MNKVKNTSISYRKVIAISVVFIIILGISVIAGNVKLNNVTIKFSNNHEITVLTSKTKVSEILQENHIMLSSDETVTPTTTEDITDTKTIIITKVGEEPTKIAEVSEEELNNIDEIAENYSNITEEIITVQEEIPFETITKDVSSGSETTNRVIQYGRNGIREVTYKVKYKEDVEIERIELSSKVIKEPVNKIVQIQTKVTSRYSSRGSAVTTATSGRYKVTAYCACIKCCGKTNGITASGTKATANRTVAAPSSFAFGTKIVMNGQTYVVEDRGGAIQGNRIDLYMNSHSEALAWGVRYLDVEVLN
ncbi:MAG: G5 domain-containing protein [Clostridia bacterium]|nr:G5 domain-containing protein [Clostridia bacterium]